MCLSYSKTRFIHIGSLENMMKCLNVTNEPDTCDRWTNRCEVLNSYSYVVEVYLKVECITRNLYL